MASRAELAREMRPGDILSFTRRFARSCRLRAREAFDIAREAVSARDEVPLPPTWLRDVGPSDFEATGEEFRRYFVEIGGLHPEEDVLEIGCGPGRMALPLTRLLHRTSRYVGIDVVAPAIRWCRRNITSRHPGFSFLHADVENPRYNPSGVLKADTYRLPSEEHSFDFVFLTSVFTHMRPEEIQHYLLEIARVLRPSGRLLCTFFLLNPTQEELAAEGRNTIDFRWRHEGFRSRDEAIPESAIAVSEDLMRAMMAKAELVVTEPVRYGTWSGREDGLSLQDVVVARRQREDAPR